MGGGPGRPAQRQRSFALIATLALLALLTIVLVAFVTMVSRDRSATQNYSQGIRAEQIALGGMDQVVSQLQQEIADPSVSTINSNGGTNVFMPLTNAPSVNAMPQRMVSAGLIPIVTMSGTNVYTNAVNLAAVGNLTTNPSLNSRKITIARWTEPNLLLPTASNNFAASTPPAWIIVTRNGPEGFPAGTTPQSAGLITSSLNNPTGAIGRYAYVVYDTSGLIDANVAGYPSTYANNAAGKGALPWADLTQLPGITSADVQNLVNWRNPATFANYATNVMNATTNGFMQVANGDTTFLSRQELIKWTQQPGNSDWQQALPYLTTFSRELNGPTWGPTTNMVGATNAMFNYHANSTTAGVQNPLIFNPRVQAPFVRNNGIEAVVGEPLVKYRFPLDKLSIFNKMATQSLTAQDITDLQRYFGVDVAADSSGYFRHLNYPTKSATYVHGVASGTSGIMMLDDVAKQNREPDFFELLQAGILQGSLGTSGYSGQSARWDILNNSHRLYGITSTENIQDYDTKETFQILRIGANIIDQWHADNYPTTITFTPTGSPTSESVYGICDLPYINQVWLKVYGPAENTAVAPSLYFYFQLWNPHQPSTYTTGPTGFRISPEQPSSGGGGYPDGYYVTYNAPGISYNNNGVFYYGAVFPFSQPLVGYPGEWTTATPVPSPFYQYAPNNGNINFTNATAGYREPSLMTANAWPMVAPNCPWTPPTNIAAICITNLVLPNANTLDNSNFKTTSNSGFQTNWAYVTNPNNFSTIGFPANTPAYYVDVVWQGVFRLQFQDPGNPALYHTYSTFVGMDDNNSISGFGTEQPASAQTGVPAPVTYNLYQNTNFTTYGYLKSDPRTFRFGSGDDRFETTNSNPTLGLAPYVTNGATFVNDRTDTYVPFVYDGGLPGNNNNPYRMDTWAMNNPSVPANGNIITPTPSYITNADGAVRPGDATYSYNAANSYATPLVQGKYANRPVVLHRPFNSVGELGYVFRDDPWKTLDFFSPSSADAGLLDLFTLSDAPVLAGRVSPNTPYAPVAAALISGATQSSYSGSAVSPANALTLAGALTNVSSVAPFVNRADLESRFMTNNAINNFSSIKTEREAVIRSLAESANTRTWNFLVDIIAQSGTYPATAATLDDFAVTGERHYWLHVAIDRYTGQVVDQQLEAVDQ